MEGKENSTFRSMHRIFEILEVLSKNPEGFPMMKIMDELDKPAKSSVYTLLQQMVKKRYVTYLENEKKYKVGPSLIKLSAVIISEHTIQKHARPTMEKLSQLTGEDTYLGVLEGDHLFYIDNVEGTESVRLNIPVGATRFIHSSCIGKLMLAYLDPSEQRKTIEQAGLPSVSPYTITNFDTFLKELKRIRQEEVSITNEESLEGIIGIAAPIKNNRHEVVAGICISAPVSRVAPRKDYLVKLVKETATEISEQIGFENRMTVSK
ncbi:IclR family transcriptional regulator [Neobacillus sp. BF23-41]|uniref:IclR family transcriptional regulator n=1 Tax=Neobacillus sp. BF23-41 TaxID=3240280 RepID=UPI0034E53B56